MLTVHGIWKTLQGPFNIYVTPVEWGMGHMECDTL